MSSLSCVSFISAVSYSYPVAEGAPVEALSEIWPYIFCYFLSLTSGKCDIFKFSVFTRALSIPLDIFLEICYFSSAGSPQVLGGECWSSACLAWHEAHVPKFQCVPWWSLIAVVTGIAAPRTSLLRDLQTSQESSKENWEQLDPMALAFVMWKGPMAALVMMPWY